VSLEFIYLWISHILVFEKVAYDAGKNPELYIMVLLVCY
jgi:hypothetical protein